MSIRLKAIRMGWQILEHKARYYVLDKPVLEDWEFDELVLDYEDLCATIGLTPNASTMIGFDQDRPVCQAVLRKLRNEDVSALCSPLLQEQAL